MSTPQPPLTPDERLALEQKTRYDKLARNVAIGGVILFPTIALLPPRKLDLYTFSLAIGFYLSADHVSNSYYGRGLIEQLTPRWGFELPTEKARETQRLFSEQKRLREGQEALREGREEVLNKQTGVLHKLWMGEEKEGWKERRLEEERKALEEGKSYTSMILEQVWEVWNWDKKKDGSPKDGSADDGREGPKKS